jgi:glyoxylase-like metal-dependent hydrolase (beta-lactamase superfamily II)
MGENNSGDDFPLNVDGYAIDILFQGYPGKSAHNGGLGWSTVVLLQGHGRVVIIDTGGPGIRVPLQRKLQAKQLSFQDITDVLLSHSHWDHIINYPLFSNAQLYIGKEDLEWANSGDQSVYAVPELYTRQLAREPRLSYLVPGQQVLPNIHVVFGPGHTPGHLIFLLRGQDRDVIFAQDAAKSKAELVSLSTDLTVDPVASKATLEKIWGLWRAREGNIVVPGHDLPMVLRDGVIERLGERRAGIVAYLGESLGQETAFKLC